MMTRARAKATRREEENQEEVEKVETKRSKISSDADSGTHTPQESFIEESIENMSLSSTTSTTSSSSSSWMDMDVEEEENGEDASNKIDFNDDSETDASNTSDTEEQEIETETESKLTDERTLKQIFDILIPKDVTERIFGQLEYSDLKNARLVCKRWTQLVDPLMIWKPYLYDYGIDELKLLIQKGHAFEILNVSKLQDFEYPDDGGLGFRNKVRAIHFLPYRNPMNGNKYVGITDRNLRNLFKELHDVEEIRLHSRALNDIVRPANVFKTFQFPLLKFLEISTLDADGPGFFVCLDAIENTYPSIEKFSASIFFDHDNQVNQHPPRYREIFEFCIRHFKTLRSFHLDYSAAYERPPSVLGSDMQIPTEDFDRLLIGLRDVQLENFYLSPSYCEGQMRFIFASTLLASQQNLVTLNVQQMGSWNRSVWVAVKDVIRNCFDTLKTIKVRGCFCPSHGEPNEEFSCKSVKQCSRLKHLQMSVCGLQMKDVSDLPNQVEFLDMGLHLDAEQISYISSGPFKNLEKWILRPNKQPAESSDTFTTIDMFKKMLQNLPALEELVIFKNNSEWKKIKKFINRTRGISQDACPEEMELPEGYRIILVNRKKFQY